MVANYVLKNRKALEDGNYIRKAPPRNYFVGFEESLVQGYVERFGEQFNLVIVGDAKEEADFYVIPYGIIRPLLTDETITIQARGRRRWLLWIEHNGLSVRHYPGSLDLGEYYGRASLLTGTPQSEAEGNDYAIENRKTEIKQRVKQSLFRQRVLANFEGRCCLAGITEPELLVASHIVPWAKRVESRLDPGNGLCLSVLYDRLFDEGFITLDARLRVIVTPHVKSLSEPLRGIVKSIAGKHPQTLQTQLVVEHEVGPEVLPEQAAIDFLRSLQGPRLARLGRLMGQLLELGEHRLAPV